MSIQESIKSKALKLRKGKSRMINKISLKKLGFVFLVTGAGCSHGPTLVEFPESADPTIELGLLETAVGQAKGNQVDVLSPNQFKKAESSLRSATKNNEKSGNAQATLHKVAEGNAYLATANTAAQVANDRIADVIQARESALSAGARVTFNSELQKTDEQLIKLTSQFEENNFNDQIQKRPILQSSYLALELKSIRENYLGAARLEIKQAMDEGAKEYAPRSLASAQKSLQDTDGFITANPHLEAEILAMSRETHSVADHLLKITRNSKSGKTKSSEDSALSLEREQNEVVDKQAQMNEVEDQLTHNQNQLIRSQSQVSGLESDQAFDRKFEIARQEFTSEEAEVYRKGDTLVIRLRGLAFPSSQSVLNSRNYPLLAKVQKVIRNFGPSSVMIEGHTDSIGGKKANEVLSSSRASAVKEYLVANEGDQLLDIQSKGFGFQKPLGTNKTVQGRAQNRRVDIIIHSKIEANL